MLDMELETMLAVGLPGDPFSAEGHKGCARIRETRPRRFRR